eukprot:SAG22_NODE_3024_length_2016_cov_1.274909_2_plen_350_part_00
MSLPLAVNLVVMMHVLASSSPAAAKGARGGSAGGKLAAAMQEADRAMSTHDLRAAEQALTSALRLSPAHPAAQFKLGMLQDATGRTAEAVSHVEQARAGLVDGPPVADLPLPHVHTMVGSMQQKHAEALAKSGRSRAARAVLAKSIESLESALELRAGNAAQATATLSKARAAMAQLQPRVVPPVAAEWAQGSSGAAAAWTTDPELLAELEKAGWLSGTTVPELPIAAADGGAEAGAWAAFEKQYYEADGGTGLPVLLRGATADWPAMQNWADKAAFARRWGGIQVPVRWPAGTRQWGLIERVATLDDYLRVMAGSKLGPDGLQQDDATRNGFAFGNACDVEESDRCAW